MMGTRHPRKWQLTRENGREGPNGACYWGLVGGRGESHPPALAEPGVKVSPHRAPTGRPLACDMRAQWAKSRG